MSGIEFIKAVAVCSVAGLFCSCQFMMQGAPAVMVPELMGGLDLSISQVGWLTSGFLYVYLLLQVPGGILADRLSARLLLLVSCLLLGLACYWFSVAGSFLEATAARGLMGVSTAPAIVVCLTLVGRWFPSRWFPLMSGFVEAYALIGGSAGPILIPYLMQLFGWREAVWTVSVMVWVLGIVIFLVVREAPKKGPQVSDGSETQRCDSQSENLWQQDKKNFWLAALYGFGVFVIINTFGGLWSVPFLSDRFPGQEAMVRESVSLIYVGAAFGAPAVGMLATAIGYYKRIMVVSALLVIVLSMLALYSDCSLKGICCICFLIGFCCGGYMLSFSVVREVAPVAKSAMYLATVNGCMLLGGPVLQPIVGIILDYLTMDGVSVIPVDHYRIAFVPIIICQLLALGAAMMLSSKLDQPAH